MRRTRFDRWPCSIARATDLLGDWWTPLVLRECFYGLRRFDELQAALGLARNVLTARLERLVEERILEKHAYQENPPRHDYRLTEKGLALFPVLLAMMAWGDEWLFSGRPPVVLHDRRNGKRVVPAVVDARTGKPIDARSIRASPGPGFPLALLAEPTVRRRFRLDPALPAQPKKR